MRDRARWRWAAPEPRGTYALPLTLVAAVIIADPRRGPFNQDYLLAEQDRAEVRVILRAAEGWEPDVLGPDDLIELRSLDVTIAMHAIYEGVWR